MVRKYIFNDYKKINNILNNNIILILEKIYDPRNLGACIRTAYAVGINNIIITKYYSCPINKTVHKTSAGYSQYINIIIIKNIIKFIKFLKYNYFTIIGTLIESNVNLYCTNFNNYNNIAIIIGSESNGISKNIINKCDLLIKIPMLNNVNSLNLSVSTGIILYEIIRQKNI